MNTSLAGLAAATMLVAVAGSQPATAMPMQNLSQVGTDSSNHVDVQYRRFYGRPYWVGPRYYASPYYASPYYAYPYRYRYYRPGPYVRLGPFGFGIW